MHKIFNTLYSKLALALFTLVVLIGLLFFLLVQYSTEMYQQELGQKLNASLAEHIVAEEPLLNDGRINQAALKEVFHMLMVVNPSIEIREGYETYVIYTEDGRALSGFIDDQDNQVVVLRTVDGQSIVVERSDIDDMSATPQSIMPEQILKPLNDQQLRDFFAYLRISQPISR